MRKRIAIIGAGVMGSNHARTVNNSPDFTIGLVIDSDEKRAIALAERYGVPHSISINSALACDASIVATNTETHYESAKKLIEEGQPILVEKPLTMRLEETQHLCNLSLKTDTPLMCGFVERFNPAISAARKVVQGQIVHLTATRHSPHPARATTGVIEDLLIHDLDLALQFFVPDVEAQSVAKFKPESAQHIEIAEVSLIGGQNQIAHLSTSRWGQRKIRQWSLSTNHQTVEVDLLQQTVVAYENIDQEVGPSGGASYRTRTVIDYPFIERAGEPLSLQLAHFARLLEDKSQLSEECIGIVRTHDVLNTIING
jgi:predicted dehydrogenase